MCPTHTTYKAPWSMGFSRQEYWSGLPCPSPGDFPTQGSNPGLPHCGQTLYHLSYQRSWATTNVFIKKPLNTISECMCVCFWQMNICYWQIGKKTWENTPRGSLFKMWCNFPWEFQQPGDCLTNYKNKCPISVKRKLL